MKKRFKNKLNIFLFILIIFILSVGIIFGISAFTLANINGSTHKISQTTSQCSSCSYSRSSENYTPNKIISSKAKLETNNKKTSGKETISSILFTASKKANEYSREINKISAENNNETINQVEGNSDDNVITTNQNTTNTVETQNQTQQQNQNQQNQAVNLNKFESQILFLINTIRAQNGLGPLAPNQMLTDVARERSNDMMTRGYFSHYTPDGKNIFNILEGYGVIYRNAGENLAQSKPASIGTPESFMNAWMNSPTHKANILRAAYGQIGIGVIDNGGRRVLTTVFMNS